MTSSDPRTAVLAIRLADADDAPSLTRLAALDSASVPPEPLLLGLLDGVPLVALSLRTGSLVGRPGLRLS